MSDKYSLPLVLVGLAASRLLCSAMFHWNETVYIPVCIFRYNIMRRNEHKLSIMISFHDMVYTEVGGWLANSILLCSKTALYMYYAPLAILLYVAISWHTTKCGKCLTKSDEEKKLYLNIARDRRGERKRERERGHLKERRKEKEEEVY